MQVIVKSLGMEGSSSARDALAKAVYAGVFNWVVAAINTKLDTGRRGSGAGASGLKLKIQASFELFATDRKFLSGSSALNWLAEPIIAAMN